MFDGGIVSDDSVRKIYFHNSADVQNVFSFRAFFS